jgi:endoglucanase
MPLIKALGLNEVAQKEFVLQPEKTDFLIYDDYVEKNIYYDNWISTGILDYYSTDKPAKGTYCIYWKDASQYNKIGFKFKPVKDFSLLAKQGFMLDFWIRPVTTNTKIKFDIRFVDTKTDDPADHPWRNKFTVDQSIIIMNGKWQHIQIPLKDFTEAGAWDNTWFAPMGKFDWSAINTLEIVAEECDLKDTEICFDEIRITAPKK